jgi:hypothetical protein
MNLSELVSFLEKYPREQVVPIGFGQADSYRGYYDEVAFEPAENTTVGAMLDEAKKAIGSTYEGYKGGEYTMLAGTYCWLARYGEIGEAIGPILLTLMLGAKQDAAKEGNE